MKCEYCGGNLSLEDAFCKHCGKPNPHSEKHIREMQHYKGEFEETKETVYQTTKAYTETVVRVAVIAVLVVLIGVVIALGNCSYDIKRELQARKVEKNFESYSQTLDTYLEEENYQAFVAFCNQNDIATFGGSYEHYVAVRRTCAEYVTVYNYIMDIVFPHGYEQDVMVRVKYLTNQMDYFYSVMDMEQYEYYEGADAPLYLEAINNMDKNIQNLLVTYMNVPAEEAAQLKDMSSGKRAYLIEESMENE